MGKIRIAPDLALPLDAATETFAILGRRGSGKTHTAIVMAEEMLRAGVQVVVLDPLDVWWGLRVSQDGKAPGLAIYVAGGSHADVPLTGDAGRVLADAVVDRGLSIVLSLRHLSKAEQRRFAGDFCERLYDRKADPQHRTALHVFIDEADAFVPQRLMPGAERCFGAVDTLVRRGRSSGLAPTLISQRPQVINKDVLSQTEVLVSHQLTGPQDRKALEAWIDANDTENQRATFMASLASLPKGTAWFWSPGLLGIFKKIAVRDRTTFDSSATPKAGVRAVASPKAFAAVDLEALTAEIAATIERAKAEDPRELRKRIAALERELAAKPAAVPAPAPERVEVPVITAEQLAKLADLVDALDAAAAKADEISDKAVATAAAIRGDLAKVHQRRPEPARPAVSVRVEAPRHTVERTLDRLDAHRRPATALAGGERKVLTVLAQYPKGRTKVQVALLTNYAHSGGGFNNYLSALRTKGWLGNAGDLLVITDAGLDALGDFPRLPPSGAALFAQWCGQVGKAERLVLEALRRAYPRGLSKDALAAATNYEASGGGFNNALSRLRTLELISGRGELVLAEELA